VEQWYKSLNEAGRQRVDRFLLERYDVKELG
jgi:hypothetical protein